MYDHYNTCKYREIFNTEPPSVPLPKNSPPHQQPAPDVDKLEKIPLATPSYPCMQVFKNTCDTHACSREISGANKRTTG